MSETDEARVSRYVEALPDEWSASTYEDAARAAIAVADEEQAALRAEVARPVTDLAIYAQQLKARAEAAEAELADTRQRLRKAEERLAAVEAGADITPHDEVAWPTPGQAWHELLEAPAVVRLHRLGRLINLASRTESVERQLERRKEAIRD